MFDNKIVEHYSYNGRILRFENSEGIYAVNRRQSLLLSTCALVETLSYTGRARKPMAALRAVELCCGGGPTAITLKDAGVGYVQASDVNPVALDSCRRNAELNDLLLDDIVVGDLFGQPLSSEDKFDLIACNFPCRPSELISENVPLELRIAIDGGPTGVSFVRPLLEVAGTHLLPGGCLLFVLTSTMDLTYVVSELESSFKGQWRLAYQTPVAQPFAPAFSDRAATVLDLRDKGKAFVWEEKDGIVWRLTWIVVVTNMGFDKFDHPGGLWYYPVGCSVDGPSYLHSLERFHSSNNAHR